jgi:uncharacterized protein YkwD
MRETALALRLIVMRRNARGWAWLVVAALGLSLGCQAATRDPATAATEQAAAAAGEQHTAERHAPDERQAADTSQPDASEPAAVEELNHFRAAAKLPPVTADGTGAAALHAHYLALNAGSQATAGLRVHTEEAGLPGYTREGALAATRSNIARSNVASGNDASGTNTSGNVASGNNAGATMPLETAVRGLIDAPLHRHGMLSPWLVRLGIGNEGGFWVVELISNRRSFSDNQPDVVRYPPDGQTDVPLAFAGHEEPNPLDAIANLAPDAKVGYPISLHFYGCDPRPANAVLSANGDRVPIYLIQPGTTLMAVGGQRRVAFVLVFAREPLHPSTTYTMHIDATCGTLGAQRYTWSFSTEPGPAELH